MKPLVVTLFIVMFPVFAIGATGGPKPPCGAALAAAYPPPGAPPTVKVWHDDDLKRLGWEPPRCAGWASSRSNFVLAMAGSFRFDGTADELVDRIGAISALPGVRYWSVTDKVWRPLVVDASALSRLDPRSRRSDFQAAEMRAGTELYYWVKHRRSGNMVYRMTVLERSPARAVVATENLSPVRFLLVTLFDPGALQSIAFVERISPGVWGIYILTRTGEGVSALVVRHLASHHEASYINSAVAIYRHLAGIPTDEEPPAAP